MLHCSCEFKKGFYHTPVVSARSSARTSSSSRLFCCQRWKVFKVIKRYTWSRAYLNTLAGMRASEYGVSDVVRIADTSLRWDGVWAHITRLVARDKDAGAGE